LATAQPFRRDDVLAREARFCRAGVALNPLAGFFRARLDHQRNRRPPASQPSATTIEVAITHQTARKNGESSGPFMAWSVAAAPAPMGPEPSARAIAPFISEAHGDAIPWLVRALGKTISRLVPPQPCFSQGLKFIVLS
jgi:hypothetical protein